MIYKRGRVYCIKYYRNGKPHYESSKSRKESAARRLLKKREGEISNGKLPGIYFDRVRFEDLAEDFLADYRINQKRSARRANGIMEHLRAFFGDFRVTQITTPKIHEYIEDRMSWECGLCKETFLPGQVDDPENPVCPHCYSSEKSLPPA